MSTNLRIKIRPPGAPSVDPNTLATDYFNHPKNDKFYIPLSGSCKREFKAAATRVQRIAEKREKDGEETGEGKEETKGSKPGDDVVVVPLGTGSAVPGTYRSGECVFTTSRLTVGG